MIKVHYKDEEIELLFEKIIREIDEMNSRDPFFIELDRRMEELEVKNPIEELSV